MQDNVLIAAVVAALNTGFTDLQISGVAVLQAYQPTNQGVPVGPSVFLHKVSDRRYGYLGRKDEWVPPVIDPPAEGFMRHTERQWYETLFQISALSIQDPSDVAQRTAADLVNYAAAIMQSDKTRAYLRSLDIGVLRVQDVRNPYFMDDKDRFEASPSFDFTLTHEQVIISTSPVVETTEFNFYRV